tara:strand:+ start:290 stop:487 length:198 start_codon:yes stop_codon:yes gene_type:complete
LTLFWLRLNRKIVKKFLSYGRNFCKKKYFDIIAKSYPRPIKIPPLTKKGDTLKKISVLENFKKKF